MGYGRALLQRDVRREQESLQKKATKKSLWGSIGRTLGGLGVMAITGGAVNPLTLGLLTGGASFLGGAIGAKAAGGKLTGGRFFQSSREEAQKELGAFGTQNITASLKSGIQAGFGQAAKLQKAKLFDKPIVATPTTKQGLLKSMDFEGSLVGKSLEKELGAFGTKNITESLKSGIKAGIGQKLKLMKTGKEATKGLDFKDSFVGKGIEKRAIGKELIKEGEASLGTRSTWAEGGRGGMTLPDGRTIGSADLPRGKFASGEITSKIDKALLDEAITDNISPREIRGKSQWDAYKSGSPVISKVDAGPQIPEITAKAGKLTASEQKQYDVLGKVIDREGKFEKIGDSYYWGEGKDMAGSGMTTQGEIKSVGVDKSGDFISRPKSPNVPLALEEEFADEAIAIDEIHEFAGFDEKKWEEQANKLYDITDKSISWQNKVFSPNNSGKPGGFDPRY